MQPPELPNKRIFTLLIAAAVLFIVAAAISAFALGGEESFAAPAIIVPAALALLALVPLLMLLSRLRALRADADMQKAMADQQKHENDRNQESILRLLDEL